MSDDNATGLAAILGLILGVLILILFKLCGISLLKLLGGVVGAWIGGLILWRVFKIVRGAFRVAARWLKSINDKAERLARFFQKKSRRFSYCEDTDALAGKLSKEEYLAWLRR